VLVAQSYLTLCDPMSLILWSDSSVHGILQVRILDRVAISFSRGSSWPRDGTWVSRIADRHFTICSLVSWDDNTGIRESLRGACQTTEKELCNWCTFSCFRLLATPRTTAFQVPLSMGFSKQECWSRLPCTSSRGSSQPRDQTHFSCLLHWQAGSLPLVPPGKL